MEGSSFLPHPAPPGYLGLLGLGLIAAVVSDCRRRTIPNALGIAILLAGLVPGFWSEGIGGLLRASGGCAVGLFGLLPFYLVRGLGAGDVKLMAAASAWFPPAGAVVAVASTLLVGGALGLVIALWTIFVRSSLSPRAVTGLALASPRSLLQEIRGTKFPYAIAIAGGVAIALVWR